jgi:hypothetical protein
MPATRFPFYIPTKGRPENQMTARNLLGVGITPTLVVEESELHAYKEAQPDCNVIAFPPSYVEQYERTPELNPHPTTGAAHNFMWDHARANGYSHHWAIDDNIHHFHFRDQHGRVHQPKELPDGSLPFRWHEDLACRYKNLAGFSLGLGHTFGSSPFTLNTRMYCSVLWRNDLDQYGIRWRRGLNDDTIVSLDILKTRYWSTAESHLLLGYKMPTSRKGRLSGGMTDFYDAGGFLRKSAEAVRIHPDCVKTVVRYGRIHHRIDYRQFTQQLIPEDRADAS